MNAQTAVVDDDAAHEAASVEAEQEANKATEEAEAAFAAGFSGARGDTSTTFENEPDKTTTTDETTTDVLAGDNPVPSPEVTTGTADDATASTADTPLTRAELEALIAKERETFNAELRRVNGRFGSLKGRVEELSKRKGLTKEDLAALQDEYPEVAEPLGRNLPDKHEPLPEFEDETDTVTPTTTGQDDSGGDVATEVTDEIDNILTSLSPGWEDKLSSKGFAVWLNTLPQSEATNIASANDPLFVAEQIQRYDAWQKAITERASAEADKQARLASAETPTRGKTSGAPESEDPNAAFEAGFQSARGGHR